MRKRRRVEGAYDLDVVSGVDVDFVAALDLEILLPSEECGERVRLVADAADSNASRVDARMVAVRQRAAAARCCSITPPMRQSTPCR
jgi:hypothetical protein